MLHTGDVQHVYSSHGRDTESVIVLELACSA